MLPSRDGFASEFSLPPARMASAGPRHRELDAYSVIVLEIWEEVSLGSWEGRYVFFFFFQYWSGIEGGRGRRWWRNVSRFVSQAPRRPSCSQIPARALGCTPRRCYYCHCLHLAVIWPLQMTFPGRTARRWQVGLARAPHDHGQRVEQTYQNLRSPRSGRLGRLLEACSS